MVQIRQARNALRANSSNPQRGGSLSNGLPVKAEGSRCWLRIYGRCSLRCTEKTRARNDMAICRYDHDGIFFILTDKTTF